MYGKQSWHLKAAPDAWAMLRIPTGFKCQQQQCSSALHTSSRGSTASADGVCMVKKGTEGEALDVWSSSGERSASFCMALHPQPAPKDRAGPPVTHSHCCSEMGVPTWGCPTLPVTKLLLRRAEPAHGAGQAVFWQMLLWHFINPRHSLLEERKHSELW